MTHLQKRGKERLLESDTKLETFGKAQVEIAVEEIENSVPKGVVVANAMASHICRRKLDLRFHKETGIYTSASRLNGVPFFSPQWYRGKERWTGTRWCDWRGTSANIWNSVSTGSLVDQ